jgi:hypothetical protein
MAVFQDGSPVKAPVKAGKKRMSRKSVSIDANATTTNAMDGLQLHDSPTPEVSDDQDVLENWPAGKKLPKTLAMNNKAIRAREKAMVSLQSQVLVTTVC